MTGPRDPERLISEFLDAGLTELPDRAYDAVRSQIDHTRQRVVIGPWKEEQVSRFAMFAVAAAAIVLVAVIGIRFLPTDGGVGVQPTATPTTPPTASSASPTGQATPIRDPVGLLQPGTYVAHPFDNVLGMDARGFAFQVPSGNWEAMELVGNTIGVAWNDGSGDSGGVGVGFLKVHSLNGEACQWSGTDDDVEFGPTVDDLLTVLTRPFNTSGYAAGEPYAENIANMTGQGIELTMQSPLPSGCDEGAFRIWNASGYDIYAQGSWNVWRLGVFDVSGERYVVMASYMPDTPDEVRGEMMDIFRSVSIDSSPGCPQYDHTCN